jgi:hypothetical protein
MHSACGLIVFCGKVPASVVQVLLVVLYTLTVLCEPVNPEVEPPIQIIKSLNTQAANSVRKGDGCGAKVVQTPVDGVYE